MIRSPRSIIGMAATLGLGLTAAPAWPDACLEEASENARECRAVCKEAFQLAKDTCSNRDHLCVEGCRADRDMCRQPHVDELNAAVAACNQTLSDAKDVCRATHPDGSTALDTCIDQAQVVAFQCRDSAREQVKPDLKLCRVAFKDCVRTNCPPTSVPDPVARRACKVDAKDVYVECRLDCQEAKQLAKDTCLDRDHACVEVCRLDRDGCRQPYVDQRNAKFAMCKTDRDAAIDNCRLLYGPGTPERDTCIDDAQVAAFICRDEAREQVANQLGSCRAAFQVCAEACPPPGEGTTTTTTSSTTTTTT